MKGDVPMAKMNQRMKEIFKMPQAAVVATATKEGLPNAVPVTMKKLLDDETVLIADNFLNKTLENMKKNPQVAITFWDKIEGYQLKGTVSVKTSGQVFEETAKWVEERAKALNMPLKAKGAVVFKIDEIYSISPGPKAGEKLS
jgi:predicted pyridoxine 5'-phosphate oxidase superfamily flavin-nucleotide-binding protein